MGQLIKVSIIMGVFNPSDRDRFLRAVASLIGQTFSRWELILYDDGSDPAHQPLIREVAGLDRRIHLLRGERNHGLAFALNEGIRLAKGKFIARMDDDDIARPDRLQKQVLFLQENHRYQWVGSNALLIDEQGVWGMETKPECPEARDFLFNSPYIHPSVLFRKETLMACGGYRTSRDVLQCEDYELFMRLHQRGFRGFNLQEPLLWYWEGRDSFRKRTYSRRVREMKVRYRGFRELGVLSPGTFPYVLKPLAVGAIPASLHRRIRRRMKEKKET